MGRCPRAEITRLDSAGHFLLFRVSCGPRPAFLLARCPSLGRSPSQGGLTVIWGTAAGGSWPQLGVGPFLSPRGLSEKVTLASVTVISESPTGLGKSDVFLPPVAKGHWKGKDGGGVGGWEDPVDVKQT